jgi:hypothetical protein
MIRNAGEVDRLPFAIVLSGEISVEKLPELLGFLGQLGVTPKVFAHIGENEEPIAEDVPIYRSDVEEYCQENDIYPRLVNRVWGALTTSGEVAGVDLSYGGVPKRREPAVSLNALLDMQLKHGPHFTLVPGIGEALSPVVEGLVASMQARVIESAEQ